MKKSLLLLVASLGFSAFAAETVHGWFDTELPKIGGDRQLRFWPTDGSDYEGASCVITNTAAGVYNDGAISFSAEEPMSVCPYMLDPVSGIRNHNPAAVEGDHYVDIAAFMKMTPFSESDLPEVPEGAKTAVIAVDSGDCTNFWVAAGEDTLYWTNTMIAADVDRTVWVKVQVRTNDLNSTVTEWNLDGRVFSCNVVHLSQLNGVSFTGCGELSDCYADKDLDLRFIDFRIEPLPEMLTLSIVDSLGAPIYPTDIGDYEVLEGREVTVSYLVPDGWLFINGTNVWTESFTPVSGPHEPCVKYYYGGEGPICDYHYGPVDGWMVYYEGPEGQPLLTVRYREDELGDALAAMKDGQTLEDYYSEKDRTFYFNADGSVTVGDTTCPAKAHYHFVNPGYGVSVEINDGEADITSVREDETDAALMSIGSVLNTFSGFDYSVIYADDVGFTEGLGETEPVNGNGEKLELKAPKGDNGKRFYRIRITD